MTTQQPEALPSFEMLAAQSQIFASAWSLVGGPFDAGDGMESAEAERAILLDMARRLHTEIETLRAGYDAARLEIASLHAQLEAVGAGDAPHAELRKTWREGQRWQTRGDPAGQWLDTTPCWYADQEYRRHPDDAAVTAAQPVAAPDGWQLVPKKPTDAMLCALMQWDSNAGPSILPEYRAMLQATPQPPAQAQEDAKGAERYRFLRDGEWRDTELEPFIRLQLNALWDSKIDAAIAAQAAKGEAK